MITREQASTLSEFHEPAGAGKCKRWRRNGRTQLWKTRPDDFRTPIKHGLYAYAQLTPANAHMFVPASECKHPR